MNVQCTRHARKAPRQGESAGEREGRHIAPKLVDQVEAHRLQQRDYRKRVRHTVEQGAGREREQRRRHGCCSAQKQQSETKDFRSINGQMRETARTVMGTALMRRR